jgi:uncharacterized membrane protein YdfJ with MMPL/SSD domain
MRLSALCARHRWVAVGLWAICLVTMTLAARAEGSHFDTSVAVPGSDSARALDLAGQALGGHGLPDTETVVVHARHGTVDDPLTHAQIDALVARLKTVPKASAVVGPFSPGAAFVAGVDPVSTNRQTAIVTVVMKGSALNPDRTAAKRLVATARGYDGPDLEVELAGAGPTAVIDTTITAWPILIALVAALLVLSLTLRSRGAVLVCALTGAVATATALVLVLLLSHATTMTIYAPLIAAVVAAGTSLGGAVVVVHRAQSCLRAGDPPEAVSRAAARMGAAIACGGFCVTLAMTAVAMVGLPFFGGVALGPAAAGAATGLVTLTLLPALLPMWGPRLLGWTERHHLKTSGRGLNYPPGLRTRWARLVRRRPLITACVSGLVLLAFAVPALALQLGGADDGAESKSLTTRRAYDLLSADYFAGANGPMLVSVDVGHGASPVSPEAVVAALAKTPGVDRAAVEVNNTQLGVAVIRLFPTTGPRSPDTVTLLHRLRDQVIPGALAGSSSQAYIGGATAIFVDMAASFQGATTEFLVGVLLVVAAFGILMLRSVTLGSTLAVAIVLAILAAAGALALLFQTSLATRVLGLATGPVDPSLLVLVLASVFGLLPGLNLSLLARLTEQPEAAPAGDASAPRLTGPVQRGHADVGHVALAMNLVMLFIFAAVAAEPARMMKVIGCGLAAGVAIDAFVLRATLLPALLHLVGPRGPQRARAAATSQRRGVPDLASARSSVETTVLQPVDTPDSWGDPTIPIRYLRPDQEVRPAATAEPAEPEPEPAAAPAPAHPVPTRPAGNRHRGRRRAGQTAGSRVRSWTTQASVTNGDTE